MEPPLGTPASPTGAPGSSPSHSTLSILFPADALGREAGMLSRAWETRMQPWLLPQPGAALAVGAIWGVTSGWMMPVTVSQIFFFFFQK